MLESRVNHEDFESVVPWFVKSAFVLPSAESEEDTQTFRAKKILQSKAHKKRNRTWSGKKKNRLLSQRKSDKHETEDGTLKM